MTSTAIVKRTPGTLRKMADRSPAPYAQTSGGSSKNVRLDREASPELRKFDSAVKSAVDLTQSLRPDYPSLGCYLELARKGAQTRADNALPAMIAEATELFADTPARAAILLHLCASPPRDASPKQRIQWQETWQTTLDELSQGLRLHPEARFELRFAHLRYEEIWRLQTDPRVDTTLTPKTKASIRIVLPLT